MTDASYIPGILSKPYEEPMSDVKPKPQPLATPVFIHDCVTPLAGETVLSLLMKRLGKDAQDE